MKKTIMSLAILMSILGTTSSFGKTQQPPQGECGDTISMRGGRPHHPMGGPRHEGKPQDGPKREPVKATPKCKCATCVELRKREETKKQIEQLKAEKNQLQHQIDSLKMQR